MQGKRSLKLLCVTRQVGGKTRAAGQDVFGVLLRENVPVRQKVQVDLKPSHELVPIAATGNDVAAMPV